MHKFEFICQENLNSAAAFELRIKEVVKANAQKDKDMVINEATLNDMALFLIFPGLAPGIYSLPGSFVSSSIAAVANTGHVIITPRDKLQGRPIT